MALTNRLELAQGSLSARSVVLGLCFAAIWSWCGGNSPALAQQSEAATRKRANRLAQETSPYLLSHAHNPVDWRPWGPEAFELARREDKPIFLSIGYSSCFWCHVMERQVFENAEIAELMNENFINIKVDREERPDLDEVYMLALQVYQQLAGSSQGGGWPLSIFLTSDGKPIAGGTYFPPADLPGRPGFPTVMNQVTAAWSQRRADVIATADLLAREVARLSSPDAHSVSPSLSLDLVQAAVDATAGTFDPVYGGFDFNPAEPDGPKFPTPSRLQLIQSQVGQQSGNESPYATMADLTLVRMATGGIRDHLGGGFHRYSIDRAWMVPHFEKMLYDNAQLAEVYVDAYRRTGYEFYRTVAEETFDFVLREMTEAHGGFASALDAETDGVEGKYYIWSKEELAKHLDEQDYRLVAAMYGIDRPQSVEHGYVLSLPEPLNVVAERIGLPVAECHARLKPIKQKLLEARSQRAPLLKDDKILTNWNGLMIRSLAHGGQVLQRRDYVDAAEKAALFLLSKHHDQDGRLLHSSRQGTARGPAFLDDYAFFISGLLALFDATGEDRWLAAARRLNDQQRSFFWNDEQGGYFYTAKDQEAALARTRTAHDSVLPSGNSVAIQNLVRMGAAEKQSSERDDALQTLRAFASQLQATPDSFPCLALGLQEYLHRFGVPADLDQPESTPAVQSPLAQAEAAPPASPSEPPASLVVALNPDPADASKHPHLKAKAYLSVDKLPAGGECRMALQLDIAETWHLNANPARPDFVVPTQVKLKSPQEVTLTDIVYPAGHNFTVAGFDEPLSVYEGQVFILCTLATPASASGEAELTVELKYQSCNDETCMRPMTMKLLGKIPVAAPGSAVHAANAALFKKLSEPSR